MICSKHSRELIRFAFGTILSLLLACSGGGGGGGGQQQPPPPPSAPTISSVQPTSGAPGIAVTIQGTNLDTVTSVAFGGVAASLGAHTATQLSTTVPSGASSGSISVTGPGGTAVSSTVFTVLPPAPTLTGFTPASGPVGTVVTLSGANLSGATSVAFGGISAAFTIASSAQINTSVPAGASTGPVGVTTPGGTANSPASFTVTVPAPIPPTITTQPQNQSVTAGASALFTVTATATPAADPLTYQWKVNKGGGFTNVSAGDGAGGATASFTTIAATVPMSGYLYECTVTDVTNGLSTTSASGILTVNSSRWLSMYYPSYQQFLMPPAEIDYTAMTHLIHWPVLPKPDGTLDTATTDFTLAHSQDVVARAHAAGVKVLLGIGGNQDSGATVGFQGATSVANRAIFIANIVGLMQARGYDGVDINWEVIRNIDAPQFTAFIQDLRAALNPIMPRPLLTLPPDSGSDFVPASSPRSSSTWIRSIFKPT